jgi:hypothetical protein
VVVSRHRLGRVGALLAVALMAAIAPAAANANAGNPQGTTSGTETLNSDGTATVTLSGSWSWPGQACGGRYGVGWAVDWWGISALKTPSPSFDLTNATEVVAAGPDSKPWSATALTTGTVSPFGAIGLPKAAGQPQLFFHVGPYYAGEDTDLCAQTLPDGTPYGPWSATATYPFASDIPAQLCVNMYDEHGTAGKSSGNPNDFSPSKDGDNSIQTNSFDPTDGSGNCLASSSLVVSGGGGTIN